MNPKNAFCTKDSEGRVQLAPVVYVKNALRGLPEGMLAYGAVEWTFWSLMAMMAFTAAYLTQIGVKSAMVGLIMALVNGVGIVAAPIMGNWSDKIGSSRRTLILGLSLSAVAYIFVPALLRVRAVGLLLGIAALLVWAFFCKPSQALVDNWVVVAADRKYHFTFGSVRLFGSIGYAIVCFLSTLVAEKTNSHEYSFYAYAVLAVPIVVIAMALKKDDRCVAPVKQKNKGGAVRLALKSYYFDMFLVSHCLAMLPLYCSMTFLPYKLIELTGTSTAFGNVNAFRALMEIPMLMFGAFFVRKFGIKKPFAFALFLYLVVQVILLSAQATWLLTFAMMLHGFAYGLYLLCQVNYVYRITPREASASAQSLSVSLALLSGVIGNLIGGVLIERFTTTGYFVFTTILEAFSLALFLVTYPLGRKLGKPEPDLDGIL